MYVVRIVSFKLINIQWETTGKISFQSGHPVGEIHSKMYTAFFQTIVKISESYFDFTPSSDEFQIYCHILFSHEINYSGITNNMCVCVNYETILHLPHVTSFLFTTWSYCWIYGKVRTIS